MKNDMINKYLTIADDVILGEDVQLNGYANLYGCELKSGVRVGPFVEIQRNVTVGKNVKIQSHTFICSGVEIGDFAFIGHGVMFTNDRFPRSANAIGELQGSEDWACEPTYVGESASIGSNATILCGITIGKDAMIGAGSVVTKSVPNAAVVAGNPAKILRYIESSA